jgi:type I restriction-modification system DNA methylase subunit
MKQRHRSALKGGSGHGAKTQIVDCLRKLGHRHSLYTVFCDFVAMGAFAFSNRVDLTRFEQREKSYLDIVKRYARDEVNTLCQAFGMLAMAYEPDEATGLGTCFEDVLGEIFMALEFGNDRAGQFFTPMAVCRLTARLTLDEASVKAAIEQRGHLSVAEPAAGAGAMVIAVAEVLNEMGFDHQRHLVVTAVDISEAAVHMAYLQGAFLGIPAVIVHGNSLTMQEHAAWLTPGYVQAGFATEDIQRGRTRYLTDAFRTRPPENGPTATCADEPTPPDHDVGEQFLSEDQPRAA